MIVGDWLGRRARLTPDKIALVDTLNGHRPVTYRQWSRSVNRTARFLLQELGVIKGDRVAVLAHNSVAYLDVWFALGRIGAILQNLNWRLTPYELEGLVADAEPIALIYSAGFCETVNHLRDRMPSVRYLAAIGERAAPEDLALSARERLDDSPLPEIDLGWDDPWVICYTGGTTGLPKGAVLTHGAITANAANTVISWGLTADDVAIMNSPLFHTGALNVFTAPLVYVGGTTIVCERFDPDQVFDLVGDAGVTLFFAVPTMFIMLQAHPRWEQVDFSHLKLIISGGAPCPMLVFEKFWERNVDFKTGYGLTEAGPNTFWLPAADVRRKPGAVGFPLQHVDVRVVRSDGSECEPDEMGELIIGGPHVCAGYWNAPEASAQAIRPVPATGVSHPWLHTGDLARQDAEGYYYIVGRLKDMIISGGENVYPAEIESVLHGHPAVAEAALIGVPDPKWGEVGCAVVAPKPGVTVGVEELLAYLRQRLARYKVPKSVILVDQLPTTAAGKIDKQQLVTLYGQE